MNFAILESQISHNKFDDEIIIVNLSSGSYFSLHDTAAEIWGMLQLGPVSARSLAGAFGVSDENVVQEIDGFLAKLAAENVVAPTAAAAVALPKASSAYSLPTIDAFDELRELLLADIVHDTDEAGWPHLATSQPAG